MIYLYGATGILLVISFIKDISKTKKSLKTAVNMFIKILPSLLLIISLVSIVLYLLPDYVIAEYLGGSEDILRGSILASLIGSISLIPGFITYPLCGLLLKKGVSYTVLAAFTTSLMMVGIITYPIEKKFLGAKLAIIRNITSYFIAIIVTIFIGIVYGEVF